MKRDSDHPVARWLVAHAPVATAAAAGVITDLPAFDGTEEAATLRAVPSRRHEFRTGRRLAREALGDLGCAPVAIPIGDQRAPDWPPGFLGSISHSRDLCAVQVAHRRDLCGIGIDVEQDVPLPPEVTAQICRDDELGEQVDPMLRFVAKEAFYKAYFPPARTFLDFQDVHVVFDGSQTGFCARILSGDKPGIAGRRAFDGRIARIAGHLVAACWISRG